MMAIRKDCRNFPALAIALLLLGLAWPWHASAQTAPKPYGLSDVIYLLQHDVSPKRVEVLARQHGIGFALTSDAESQLRGAGASDELVGVLRELAPKTADLVIQSTPGNASIYLDGNLVGATDADGRLRMRGLAPGGKILRVSREGYQDSLQNVTLVAGKTATVTTQLEIAKPPELIVQANLVGAQVYVDGQLAGSTDAQGKLTVEKLTAGAHQVRVSSFLYSEYQQEVKLAAGESPTVTAKLSPLDLSHVELRNPSSRKGGAWLSPDGRYVAAWGEGHSLRIHDTATDQLVSSITPNGRFGGFSPDGSLIATYDSRAIEVWEVATGALISKFPGRDIQAAAISPDHRSLARIEITKINKRYGGVLRLSDISTGRETLTFEGDTDGLPGEGQLFFSPDGRFVIAPMSSGTPGMWETATGHKVRDFHGQGGLIEAFALSRDGRRLAAGTMEGNVELWDTSTGQQLWVYRGHAQEVGGVAFTPDGRNLASVSANDTLIMWEVATGLVVRKVAGFEGGAASDNSIAFSPDGRYFVTVGSVVLKWQLTPGAESSLSKAGADKGLIAVTREVAPGTPVLQVQSTPPGAQVYVDGQLAGSTDAQGNLTVEKLTAGAHQVRVSAFLYSDYQQEVKLAAGESPTVTANLTPVSVSPVSMHVGLPEQEEVTLSPDGRYIATWDGYKGEGDVGIWDAVSEKLVRTVKRGRIFQSFSPDGSLASTTDADGSATAISDVQTGELLCKIHLSKIKGFAFSQDKRFIATLNTRKDVCSLKLWDTSTGHEGAAFDGEPDCGGDYYRGQVVFSPDGRFVAAGSRSGGPIVWETASGHKVWEKELKNSSVSALAFSPDSRRLAWGVFNGTVRLVDASTGQERWRGTGCTETHELSIYSLAFTADGHCLVSASGDGTLKFWDVTTGAELRAIHDGHVGGSIALTPDGRYLMSLGYLNHGPARWQLGK